MQDNRKGNALVIVGIVVLAIIVILFFVWKPTQPQGTSSQLGVPTYAPAGQLTPQFPKELILDSAAQISSSYVINYSSSSSQYTAEWSSSSSMASLYTRYLNYFPRNGWVVVSKKSSATLDGVSAARGYVNANVAIFPKNNATEVVVSYTMQ
jgi:hypothetical protein